MAPEQKIILSGSRPTGRLHLGNYTGAVENWVALQKEYRCYFMVADWHVLTTDYQHTGAIAGNTREMVLDWISAGIDPERSTVFVQSHIKEHAELYLLLAMLISTARLERNPTLKEQVRDLAMEDGEGVAYGHLGYPVLQAADILVYRAHVVPVGEDQLPHVEITRELARKFNRLYGEVFPIPEGKITKFARFPGLDGRRMSKSLGNTIELADSREEILEKIKTAFTDPARKRRSDPGHPEVCLIYYAYWQKFKPEKAPEIYEGCTTATLGCVDCKRMVGEAIADYLAPLREKRAALEATPGAVDDVIHDGDERARRAAASSMALVREGMQIG